MIEHMTLDELLKRKAKDYGYGSVRAMSRALGLKSRRLEAIVQGMNGMTIEIRRAIVQQLDVDPEVLDRMR